MDDIVVLRRGAEPFREGFRSLLKYMGCNRAGTGFMKLQHTASRLVAADSTSSRKYVRLFRPCRPIYIAYTSMHSRVRHDISRAIRYSASLWPQDVYARLLFLLNDTLPLAAPKRVHTGPSQGIQTPIWHLVRFLLIR